LFGFGKGKVEIQLEKFNFKPGETITGTVKLLLKKPVQARQLRVVFYGIQNTRNTGISLAGSNNCRVGSNNYRNRNNSSVVHKFEMSLDGEKEYAGGEYPFSINIPASLLDRGAKPDGALGTALQAAQFLSGSVTSLKWFVESSLDMPMGLDISKKVQVNITL